MNSSQTTVQTRSAFVSPGSWPSKMVRRAGRGALFIILTVVGFTFLIPLLWLVSTSLKTAGQVFIFPIEWLPTVPQWHNYLRVFQDVPFAVFMRNTAVVCLLGVLGTVLSSVSAAYSLGRLRWRGRNAVFWMVLATMMLPGIVLLIPHYVMFSRIRWINTLLPLWAPSWFGSSVFIFMLRQFMMGIPYDLDEAARIDGASSFRILWQIIAPLSKPAITAVSIFSFLAHYNNLMGPLMYLSSTSKFTVPIGLIYLNGRYHRHWNLVMTGSMVSITPIILLFFIAQRHFIRGIVLTGLAGR